MLTKEQRKQLNDYKVALKKEMLQRKWLLSAKSVWGTLESLIQKCNQNPYLSVTVTLGDGTKIELKTAKENKRNPLFTDAVYNE